MRSGPQAATAPTGINRDDKNLGMPSNDTTPSTADLAPADSTPPPRRRGYALAYLAGIATTLVVLVVIAMTAPSLVDRLTSITEPSEVTLSMRGTITMPEYGSAGDASNFEAIGDRSCQGTGGYEDMTRGASVTVYDSSGKVIGTAGLLPGVRKGEQPVFRCEWAFEVTDLPESDFYQVEVSHRGRSTVQRDGMEAVALTLG